MAIEEKRGCGYRKVHGLYLMGSGMAASCDQLPFVLKECEYCGFIPHMFRGFTWIDKRYLLPDHLYVNGCKCSDTEENLHPCPICHPSFIDQERYGFMWVSKMHYTPESFIKEAQKMKVSKRISYIPKDLKIGSWILVAHKKVAVSIKEFSEYQIEGKKLRSEPIYIPAIFYAFKLQRIEYLIWESEATPMYLEELKKKGLTPIIIPDGDPDHKAVAIKK